MMLHALANKYTRRTRPSTDRGTQSKSLGRVFIGVWEVANIITTVAEALQSAGHHTRTLAIDSQFNPFYSDNNYDDRVRWAKGDRVYRAPLDRTRFNLQMAWRLLQNWRHDTFIFIWRYSFLPLQLDIPLLRLAGKKVIVIYCGDDIRYRPMQVDIDRTLPVKPWWPYHTKEALEGWMAEGRTFWEAFWSTKLTEKSGARIMASRDTATFQGQSYGLFKMPQKMLVSKPREANDCPLLIHAPTAKLQKGTAEVREAVAQLQSEGLSFRFQLVQGMPNRELHALLKTTDIVIDQPGVWPGRLGIEAMAAGCVVVGGNQPCYWGVSGGSPVQQFERNSQKLADLLRDLISNHRQRTELMRESFNYVRTHYSYEVFTAHLSQILNGEGDQLAPLPQHKNLVKGMAATRMQKLAISLFW